MNTVILISIIYYIFSCACMNSYLYSITDQITIAKIIMFTLVSLVLAPIYTTVLIGLKLGELFSRC